MNKNDFKIVLGVIGNDIHIVANHLLSLVLKEQGYKVCNLGTRNSPDDFVDAACEIEAHAVLVSSINGEAEYWCGNFRKRFDSVGFNEILLYIGGNLVIGSQNSTDVEKKFAGFGFDRIFYCDRDLKKMIVLLQEDLNRVYYSQ